MSDDLTESEKETLKALEQGDQQENEEPPKVETVDDEHPHESQRVRDNQTREMNIRRMESGR